MAAKPYRPKMTAAEKKAYKNRNFGAAGKTGGMGGKYGRKSENLTAKQLKASGALAASKKRTVDISQTKRDDTRGITLGPGGKPLTGTVKLLNGKTAVYKGGKRVQKSVATPKAKTTSKSSVSPTPKAKGTVTRVSPSDRGEGSGGGGLSAYKANKLGVEGPKYGNPVAKKSTSYGPYKSRADVAKEKRAKAAALAAKNRKQSKPTSGTKMKLVRQKDGSLRWVKVI